MLSKLITNKNKNEIDKDKRKTKMSYKNGEKSFQHNSKNVITFSIFHEIKQMNNENSSTQSHKQGSMLKTSK